MKVVFSKYPHLGLYLALRVSLDPFFVPTHQVTPLHELDGFQPVAEVAVSLLVSRFRLFIMEAHPLTNLSRFRPRRRRRPTHHRRLRAYL
jgi:hypothetical protein